MCDVSDVIGYDRRRTLEQSNAALHVKQDTLHQYRGISFITFLNLDLDLPAGKLAGSASGSGTITPFIIFLLLTDKGYK